MKNKCLVLLKKNNDIFFTDILFLTDDEINALVAFLVSSDLTMHFIKL